MSSLLPHPASALGYWQENDTATWVHTGPPSTWGESPSHIWAFVIRSLSTAWMRLTWCLNSFLCFFRCPREQPDCCSCQIHLPQTRPCFATSCHPAAEASGHGRIPLNQPEPWRPDLVLETALALSQEKQLTRTSLSKWWTNCVLWGFFPLITKSIHTHLKNIS